MKATSKIIGTLIKRKSKGIQYPTQIIWDNYSYTEKKDIANQLNQHFVTVRPNLANSLGTSNEDPCKYIICQCLVFFMSNVSEYQVQCLFNALDKNKDGLY